jgi:hypothetical protein
MSSSPKRTPNASAGKRMNAGFMFTPEQHEEIGHRFKTTNPERAAVHYRLAEMIRNQIKIQTGRTH